MRVHTHLAAFHKWTPEVPPSLCKAQKAPTGWAYGTGHQNQRWGVLWPVRALVASDHRFLVGYPLPCSTFSSCCCFVTDWVWSGCSILHFSDCWIALVSFFRFPLQMPGQILHLFTWVGCCLLKFDFQEFLKLQDNESLDGSLYLLFCCGLQTFL